MTSVCNMKAFRQKGLAIQLAKVALFGLGSSTCRRRRINLSCWVHVLVKQLDVYLGSGLGKQDQRL